MQKIFTDYCTYFILQENFCLANLAIISATWFVSNVTLGMSCPAVPQSCVCQVANGMQQFPNVFVSIWTEIPSIPSIPSICGKIIPCF